MAAGPAAPGATGLPSEWGPTVDALVRSLDEARYFRGSLVVVHGPVGVGKSRLIDAALAQALVPNRRIRRTFLEARDVENPYKAVLSLAGWASKLEESAPTVDSGSLVLAPFIRAIAAGPAGPTPEPPSAGRATASRPQPPEYERLVADLEFYKRGVEAWGERSRFLHEVGWMILDAAARRHVVWIVESAQFLDPNSLTVLRYLAACLEENPLVIWLNVDSTEDGVVPKPLASLLDTPSGRCVAVPRLSRTAITEVLARKHPGQVVPPRLVDVVLVESHGLLLTAEQLASDPRVWGSSTVPAPDVTPGVLGLVLRKLDGLPAAQRELVDRLAIVGGALSVETATRLVHTDEASVRADLTALVAAGILLEQDQGQYSFRLTGLAGEIESQLAPERARSLHREVAETLESSPPGFDEQIFDLAQHWRKAEAWDRASRACLTAARFSSDSFAPEGGLLYAQRALEAARASSPRDPSLEAEALVEQGRALYDLGRLRDSVAALREALTLIGDHPAAWPARARGLFYLARALSSLHLPQEALEIVEEASNALGQVADARARLMLHQVIGVAFMMSDQNREAVGHFRAMLELAEKAGDGREVAYAQKNLSAVLLTLDPHDAEGWRLVDAAIEHHTKTNNFAGLAAGYLNRSVTRFELKNSEGALRDLARSRQAAEQAHAPLILVMATLQEVTILLNRMAFRRAEELLKALAPWMPAMEDPSTRQSYVLLLGRVAEAQGRSDEAERFYEEATLLAEPGGESPALWESRLRRAALAKRSGALDRYRRLREGLPTAEQLARSAPALVPLRTDLDPAGGPMR